MLQPRTYPELLGKALVLEAQPFEALTDDDEPWAEGFFLVLLVGLVVGLAQLIGGMLRNASLPPANVVLETIINGWQQFHARLALPNDVAAIEASIRQGWSVWTQSNGYDSGWAQLLVLITTPLGLVAGWLVVALVVFAAARTLGGTGTLSQTLGATALMVAPQGLLLLQVLPFVSISWLLLLVWSLLILYRAAEVAHDLPWVRAVWVALAPAVLLLGLALVGLLLFGLVIGLRGVA
jgi:hypothetical protein